MQQIHLPLVQSYQPTTFLERGVAVPFTAPLLSGSRVRPASRGGIELIVPNPAGGRGVYVLTWEHVRELCQPTVHDTLLTRGIIALPSVTPSGIRAVAREVAAGGMAGEAAAQVATSRASSEREDRLVVNFLLLITLIKQIDPRGIDPRFSSTEIEQRGRQAVAAIAPRLARKPEDVVLALEQLADLLQGVGLQGQTPPPRVPRLLAMLRQVRADVASWARERADMGSAASATMICMVADLTLLIAQRTLDEALGLTADMPGLLLSWAQDPARVAWVAGRPEWLLDGWEQIFLFWRSADDDNPTHAVLAEMAQMVPVVPREAADWIGEPVEFVEQVNRFRRTVLLNEDWRTGAQASALIDRNERLRALAA